MPNLSTGFVYLGNSTNVTLANIKCCGGVKNLVVDDYNTAWTDGGGNSVSPTCTDCNGDGIPDYGQILLGDLSDSNNNSVPSSPKKSSNPNKSKDTTNEPLDSNTKQSILFVGDSVTAGSYSYPNIIAKKYPNILVDILAIGGKTTGWMLDNLPTQLALKKYDRVYVYGGINDSFNDSISSQTALNNVQKMVNLITNSGATAVVIIGYNTDNSTDFNKIPTTIYVKDKTLYIPMIEKYKKYQDLLKTNIQNAKFVGKFEIGKLSDGLHPSSTQHAVIAKIIKDGL
jgi:lysophospholipase L1-like esterase